MWGMGGWTGSDDAESSKIARSRRGARVQLLRHRVRVRHGQEREAARRDAAASRRERLYIATKVPAKNMKWPGSADVPASDTFPYRAHHRVHAEEPREPRHRQRGPSAAARVERRVGRRRRMAARGRRAEAPEADPRLRHQREPLAAGQRAEGARHRPRGQRAGGLQHLRPEPGGPALPRLPRARRGRHRASRSTKAASPARSPRTARGRTATGGTCTSRRRTWRTRSRAWID